MIARVVQCPFDFFGVRCVYAVKTDKGEYMLVDDVRDKEEGYKVYRMDGRYRTLCEMVHTAETLDACKDYIQYHA